MIDLQLVYCCHTNRIVVLPVLSISAYSWWLSVGSSLWKKHRMTAEETQNEPLWRLNISEAIRRNREGVARPCPSNNTKGVDFVGYSQQVFNELIIDGSVTGDWCHHYSHREKSNFRCLNSDLLHLSNHKRLRIPRDGDRHLLETRWIKEKRWITCIALLQTHVWCTSIFYMHINAPKIEAVGLNLFLF